MCAPWSKKISVHGPQGPVSPICQKLSEPPPGLSPMRTILSLRHARFLVPEVEGLVVGGVHRDHEARRIDLQRAGDEVPGEADGVLLEVVAEGEVAEHLEEGVVAGGVAHVLEVVVLAAGAHAALAGGGAHVVALVAAQEAVLELHHAGVGEQQRRVVARHEAGGRDHGVAALAEKFEEGATDVRRAHERRFLGHGARRLKA